jgi:gliding motility-associated protein GldM
MYLVLTALLALNVSSEILNAFKTVKSSLDNSSVLAGSKTTQLFASFQKKMEDPASREMATKYYQKAQEAHRLAEESFKYIESLKMELMREAGYNPPKDTTFKEDNLEAATRLFVEEAPHGKGKGKELYNKLKALREQLLGVDSSAQTELGITLPIDLTMPKTQNAGNNTWEAAYFRMTPTIAALTILSKFQNDIRNSETQVVELLHKKIGEVIFTYDAFKVIANSSSSYMMPGDEFTINAGIGAYSSKAEPQVSVEGQTGQRTPEGDYEIKLKAPETPGDYQKTVTVNYKDQKTGKIESATRIIKYTVGQPSGLTVSTDATRVFYSGGLKNPLSVTGAGGSEKIHLTVEAPGTSVEDNGKGSYMVTCSQTGVAVVKVTDGKSTQQFNIKIKRVPDPVAMVNNKQGGDMPASQFKAAGGVQAKLVDFIFEGYSFKVVSFAMQFSGTGFEEKNEIVEVTGNAFSAEARKFMNRCSAGTNVLIGAIRVADQIGNVRDLEGNMTFVLE